MIDLISQLGDVATEWQHERDRAIEDLMQGKVEPSGLIKAILPLDLVKVATGRAEKPEDYLWAGVDLITIPVKPVGSLLETGAKIGLKGGGKVLSGLIAKIGFKGLEEGIKGLTKVGVKEVAKETAERMPRTIAEYTKPFLKVQPFMPKLTTTSLPRWMKYGTYAGVAAGTGYYIGMQKPEEKPFKYGELGEESPIYKIPVVGDLAKQIDTAAKEIGRTVEIIKWLALIGVVGYIGYKFVKG